MHLLVNNKSNIKEKLKILIVEECVEISSILKNLLSCKYQALEANNFNDCLKKIQESKFNLIIFDFRISKCKAYTELIDLIKNFRESAVLITCSNKEAVIEIIKKKEVKFNYNVIEKPYTFSELEKNIKNLIRLTELKKKIRVIK